MENKAVYLKDYKKPNYLISKTFLHFNIYEDYTEVDSTLIVVPNYSTKTAPKLVLDGENLTLLKVIVNGVQLSEKKYSVDENSLTLPALKEESDVRISVRIKPQENKSLEGLYCSKGMYCTQNEPEGFRHITYYIDRPDNMSVFDVCVEADKEKYPILLSNGNPIHYEGDIEGGRHAQVWSDPFPKPSYLFALVAGDLAVVKDEFTTMSGKRVPLEIYVNHGNEDRCQHSLDSLKKSMKWDEDVFGLEYDLDLYMIVAVDDFNSGAMENKGLNIFNSSLALAKTETATDSDYNRIEGVIAHEYFHNWTGNRVTCRDWFQLTLKEGLTVFRDQEFSSDMHSRAVQRIDDVSTMISYQFAEDAGKTSHSIQPSSYMEINNFYTSTVYNKGAEVIRMIQSIIGKENFRKGMDKYFELNDGKAVTTEDFIHAMELASKVDLKQFRNWYTQSRTPTVKVKSRYSAKHKTYTLTFKQSCEPADGYKNNKPFHIPVKIKLLGKEGKMVDAYFDISDDRVSNGIVHLKKKTEKIVFEEVLEKPIPSLLREFSAPVNLEYDYTDRELAFLSVYDDDTFNRKQACKIMLRNTVDDLIKDNNAPIPRSVTKLFKSVLSSDDLDNSYKVCCLSLPSTPEIIGRMEECDYEGIFKAKKILTKHLSNSCHKEFNAIFKKYKDDEFSLEDDAVGRRKIKNFSLSYLLKGDKSERYQKYAFAQMNEATNMTDELAALGMLSNIDSDEAKAMTEQFKDKWKDDFLVMNKWFAMMSYSDLPRTIDRVKEIANTTLFDNKNPNSLRYLYGGFASNVQFHDTTGEGYKLLSDVIIAVDKFNHKIAAGLCRCFKNYYKMDEFRKNLMKSNLELILDNNPSKDVYEIVSKTLS
jgi:aminopeptidase N